MPSRPAPVAPDDTGYIRGGGGVRLSGRRVSRVLAYLCLVVLAAVALELTVSGLRQNNRADRLQRGTLISATVTGCDGVSSGIGMGIEYWQCRVSYSFAGRNYEEALGGSRIRMSAGTPLQAVVDPGHPRVVSTVGDATKRASFVAAIAVGASAVLLFGIMVATRRPKQAV